MKGTANQGPQRSKNPKRSKYRRSPADRPAPVEAKDEPWFIEAKEARLLEAVLDEIEPLLTIATPHEQEQPYEELYNLLVDMKRGINRFGAVNDADYHKITDKHEAVPRYIKMHAKFMRGIGTSTSAEECEDLQNKADKAAWRAWQCHRASSELNEQTLMNYVKAAYAAMQ